MRTKTIILLNTAIEEAMNLGFKNRYVLHDHSIYSLLTNMDFPESAYAIVDSYPVRLNNGQKTFIHYIVLNNGQLGFMIDEIKKIQRHKQHISLPEQNPEEDAGATEPSLENSLSDN